jgi:hypothetical protein
MSLENPAPESCTGRWPTASIAANIIEYVVELNGGAGTVHVHARPRRRPSAMAARSRSASIRAKAHVLVN